MISAKEPPFVKGGCFGWNFFWLAVFHGTHLLIQVRFYLLVDQFYAFGLENDI
jgi:hypothetical protein